MGARIIVYKPENKCGYIFKEKKVLTRGQTPCEGEMK